MYDATGVRLHAGRQAEVISSFLILTWGSLLQALKSICCSLFRKFMYFAVTESNRLWASSWTPCLQHKASTRFTGPHSCSGLLQVSILHLWWILAIEIWLFGDACVSFEKECNILQIAHYLKFQQFGSVKWYMISSILRAFCRSSRVLSWDVLLHILWEVQARRMVWLVMVMKHEQVFRYFGGLHKATCWKNFRFCVCWGMGIGF